MVWLKFTYEVWRFQSPQYIFGERDKKPCISETVWAREQCQVFLKTWKRLFSAGLFLKLLGCIVLPQTALKVGAFSAENRLSLHVVLRQSITVRMMLLISLCGIPSQDSEKVWHCFLAQTVLKLFTFHWRSTEFLNG